MGRRCNGQELARLAGKEKHENINNPDLGCAGDERFRANFQGAARATTTGQSNGHTATDRTTPGSPGGGSAGGSGRESIPNAESVGASPIRHMGGTHLIRSRHSGKVEGH